MRERNLTSKISDVEKLVLEAFKHITPEKWKACIEHVIKEENDFAESDAMLEEFENDDENDDNLEETEMEISEEVPGTLFNAT